MLAGLATLAVLVGVPLAMLRLVNVAAGHRRFSLTAATAFVSAWVLCFATGVQAVQGAPVASTSAAALTVDEVQLVRADLADLREFSHEIDTDPYAEPGRGGPAGTGLRAGRQGRAARLRRELRPGGRQDTSYSEGITQVLDQGTQELAAAGYHAQSAFLTSPTFGAGSWLAHASLQSGLWVDSQRRYRQLLGADRMTLTDLFGRAGWRTVFDVPANTEDWPEGQEFYDFERLLRLPQRRLRGPEVRLRPDARPVHPRGLPPPRARAGRPAAGDGRDRPDLQPPPVGRRCRSMVPWDQVGDGSVYDGMPEQGESSKEVFRDPEAVKRVYGESVEYSWQALTSFLTTYDDPNLVLVVLGDHQPHTYVSGEHAGHDVPISVIAQDPAVMERIAGWGWQDGLRPSPDATVWRMDTFRDRFLEAFGS